MDISMAKNKGYDSAVIKDYAEKMRLSGKNFILSSEDEMTDEMAHFLFIGKHEGKEVLYDTVMYTLRLQHESELFDIAEHRAARQFADYVKITYDEDENGNLKALDEREEEIGMFMAEVILELEEEESIKVNEHVDYDMHADFGIGLDVGLHISHITSKEISRFVEAFNSKTLKLDKTLYSFQTNSE
jgi:hypothetical protein